MAHNFYLILYSGAAGFGARGDVPEGWQGPDFGARAGLLARIEAALPAFTRSPWSEMGGPNWSVILTSGTLSVSFDLREPAGNALRLCVQGDLSRAAPLLAGLYEVEDWGVVDEQSARLNAPGDLAQSLAAHADQAGRAARRPHGGPSLLQRIKSAFRP
ncbi:MAG: hypothetical protein AAF647_14115 [Pseudomonadota bacterium]